MSKRVAMVFASDHMKTIIEIEVPFVEEPLLRRNGDGWVITGGVKHVSGLGRALWVRTWNPDDLQHPVDGKGITVNQKRKLKGG